MNGLAYTSGTPGVTKASLLWKRASTLPVIAALIYFSLNGLSPFVNDDIYLRFANTAPDSSILARVLAWPVYLICGLAIVTYRRAVLRHFFRLKSLALLPFLAIASSCWSQAPLYSLRQGTLLLGATLFAVFFVFRFSSREQMQLLMSCGAVTAIATVLFALLLPRYGLDHLGGHEHAWKGVFSAKNVCGQTMLLFLTPALYHRARTGFTKALQAAYILLLIGVILMSQALTSWIFLGLLLAFRFGAGLTASFERKDLGVVLTLLLAVLAAFLIVAFENRDYILALLEKTLR